MVYCWQEMIVLEETQKGKTMPNLGARKEMSKFFSFSWHSDSNHYALSSVVFYVHWSIQVAEHFLKV